MWARHLLFVGCCLAGTAALGSWVLRPSRVIQPRDYNPASYERDEFRQVVEQINAQFRSQWQQQGIEPVPAASDLALARRLSLGLCGTIPSLEEIRALEAQPPEQCLQWWLSHLLEDRRSADFLAERLARAYVGVENGPFLIYRRRRFVTWLADQLQENAPYDRLVRELISDTGLWTNSPAVNFVTVTVDGTKRPDEARLAARVSRAFLGTRIDCVQCHDDMLGGDRKQQDFHQLAAFFAGTRNSFTGIRETQRPYRFQYHDSDREEEVPAEVPFAPELRDPQRGSLRSQLARWVTHPQNKAFARATVNRIWAIVVGRPLVEPIDSLPIEGSFEDGTFPPGLEILADDFIAHRYDLRRLIRLIAQTEVFARDSRGPDDEHPVTVEQERLGAAFPLVRLRPEQMAGSILQASSLRTIDAESHILVKLTRYDREKKFVKQYGDSGEDEFDAHGGTVPQRLLLLNGELVKERTKDDPFNAATHIAQLAADDEKAVEILFLAVLTRRPTNEEREHFVARLRGTRQNQRSRRMEDLYWTLLNSTEFSWNH